MKKITCIVLLALLMTSFAKGQARGFKNCVKSFYALLYNDKPVTIREFEKVYDANVECWLRSSDRSVVFPDTLVSKTFLKMKAFQSELTQGLNYEEICKRIEQSPVYNEGFTFSSILELKLSQSITIFFELNIEEPNSIEYVWLCSGKELRQLLDNKSDEDNWLWHPGTTNDPDGYTNIREQPDKQSKIVGKVVKDELFYYAQPCGSDWYLINKNITNNPIGYIHKSKILPYPKFSPKLRKKVEARRGGC